MIVNSIIGRLLVHTLSGLSLEGSAVPSASRTCARRARSVSSTTTVAFPDGPRCSGRTKTRASGCTRAGSKITGNSGSSRCTSRRTCN